MQAKPRINVISISPFIHTCVVSGQLTINSKSCRTKCVTCYQSIIGNLADEKINSFRNIETVMADIFTENQFCKHELCQHRIEATFNRESWNIYLHSIDKIQQCLNERITEYPKGHFEIH